MDISEMLAAFPADRSWPQGLCKQDPGGPGDCHGRICQRHEFSQQEQEVIEFLRESGSENNLMDSETPHQALMNTRAVLEYLKTCSERDWRALNS